MLKSELIAQLAAEYPDITPRAIERAVNRIFEAVISRLEQGGRVELRGFGSFDVRARKAGHARNPKTGALVEVGSRRVAHFKVSRPLLGRLNPEKLQPARQAVLDKVTES